MSTLKIPNVLLLCNNCSQMGGLDDVLMQHAAVTSATDLSEAVAHLENSSYDAFLCCWSFHLGTWQEALREAQRLRPDLPVIVFSATAGERQWASVLEAGGFDLLMPPYVPSVVLPSLEHAVATHEARLLRSVAR
jgi:CheY-like chemotaxis protein